MYRQAPRRGVIRIADGTPIDKRDPAAWAEYEAWVRAGNLPAPPLPEPAPTPTRAERVERLRERLREHWDAQARAAGFDGIADALLHAGFPHARRAQAIALGQWEVACRQHVAQLRAEVVAGTREPPTAAELIAELPDLVLP